MRAGIALGSNLGNRLQFLQKARDQLFVLPEVEPPLLQSPVYETEPVDCEPGIGPFYNAVIELGWPASPQRLLTLLREIEQALGRPWQHARNVARTIDLDLLYCGTQTLDTAELKLPHPRMFQRAFVLIPLREIAPDLRLPGQTANVSALAAHQQNREQVNFVTDKW